jgi:hypothetical protein
MQTTVFATFRVSGMHYWPGALAPYEYLGNLHRHVFHVKVTVFVDRDRQVEFIELGMRAEDEFKSIGGGENTVTLEHIHFGGRSCEMLAKELWERLLRCGYRVKQIEVSEDGENGAVVEL